jgi:L-ascorbate metabolism protein UlaG (beta-lactamase superfamily)
MIITHQGGASFKISQGDLALAINPQTKTSADVTLFSTLRSETAEKSGFVIDGPGEYEVKDIFIKGFLSEGKDVFNTVYLITFEGMRLCFLGALANPELKSEVTESLEDIDILFVPTGGQDVLDPAPAYKLAVSLEPSIIIPMSYDKTSLGLFLKEGGQTNATAMEKFVVKKKDLEGKEGEIVVLKEE